MNSFLYVEGGSKGATVRCKEGFRKLFEKCGLAGQMPRIVAWGSRAKAFENFRVQCETRPGDYVAMLVDSEDPIKDIEAVWAHLKVRDGWNKLPARNLEASGRDDLRRALERVTSNCKGGFKAEYAKGDRSFELLGRLDPVVLTEKLPSFKRVVRILKENL